MFNIPPMYQESIPLIKDLINLSKCIWNKMNELNLNRMNDVSCTYEYHFDPLVVNAHNCSGNLPK